MSFRRYQSPSRMMKRMKTKASTAIVAGALLSIDTSGFLVHAVSGDAIVGIAQEDKSASDATTTPILVDIIQHGDVLLADAVTTTPAQTDIGETVTLVDHLTVNVGASTNNDCFVVDLFGTATDKVLVTLNKLVYGKNA